MTISLYAVSFVKWEAWGTVKLGQKRNVESTSTFTILGLTLEIPTYFEPYSYLQEEGGLLENSS